MTRSQRLQHQLDNARDRYKVAQHCLEDATARGLWGLVEAAQRVLAVARWDMQRLELAAVGGAEGRL